MFSSKCLETAYRSHYNETFIQGQEVSPLRTGVIQILRALVKFHSYNSRRGKIVYWLTRLTMSDHECTFIFIKVLYLQDP